MSHEFNRLIFISVIYFNIVAFITLQLNLLLSLYCQPALINSASLWKDLTVVFQYCSLSVFITFFNRNIFFCYIECENDYFRWRSYQWLWRAYCNFLIKRKSPSTLGAHGILLCLMWTFLIILSRQPVLRRWIAQNVSNISCHILSITKLFLGVTSIKWTPVSRVL